MSEQRKYRSWTAQQKLEIVLAGLRGDRSVRDVCREHGISETLHYGWRDRLLEVGPTIAREQATKRKGRYAWRNQGRVLERGLPPYLLVRELARR